jgi:hypothetical protein
MLQLILELKDRRTRAKNVEYSSAENRLKTQGLCAADDTLGWAEILINLLSEAKICKRKLLLNSTLSYFYY